MRFEPREIIDEGDRFSIRWADDEVSEFDAPNLRRACACAGCVHEWTGEQMLKAESISDDIKIEEANLVGRYALNFKFSDGHETGIYSFKYLRELAEREK
jgi:DUF971 family protein